jgi:hypothetical protein
MAETPEAGVKNGLGFLAKKVGPLPLGIWMAAGGGIWWYLTRKKTAAAAGANQQTDPAGNVGTIDPATGYVSGSPEDTAALAANNAGSTGTGSAGGGASSGGQSYADNNSWGIAAVNYLVGLGIDATTANQAIQLFLTSQPLTTSQQGDVNLAIGALGPPPTLPGPVTGNPPPVTHPPGGKPPIPVDKGPKPPIPVPVKKPPPGPGPKPPGGGGGGGKKPTAPPPTGLTVVQKHSTSLQVRWNKSRNATGYHVKCTDMATKKVTNEFDVAAAQTDANCGSLTAGHSYVIDVWAEPEAGSPGTGAHAEVSTTLPKTG